MLVGNNTYVILYIHIPQFDKLQIEIEIMDRWKNLHKVLRDKHFLSLQIDCLSFVIIAGFEKVLIFLWTRGGSPSSCCAQYHLRAAEI